MLPVWKDVCKLFVQKIGFYVPTFAQISTVNVLSITPTYFAVNIASWRTFKVVLNEVVKNYKTNGNLVIFRYDKILVNVTVE
jgi:hypothetical protein